MLSKFAGEPAPAGASYQHVWPGSPEGFPIRLPAGQQMPLLKDDEYLELPHHGEFEHKLFVLSNTADAELYTKIMDRWANGACRIIAKQLMPDPEKGEMRVYLEWVAIYAAPDPAETRRVY